MKNARDTIHELYQENEFDFKTMCKLFDMLIDLCARARAKG